MLSSRRLLTLGLVFSLLLVLALVQALRVQVVEGQRYAAQARYQQLKTYLNPAPRGRIFDRSGAVLAVSQRAYLVRLDPAALSAEPDLSAQVSALAEALSPATGRPVEQLQQQIRGIIADSRSPTPTLSTILAYNLSPEVTHMLTTTVAARKLRGLLVEKGWARVYPQGLVAGPLIGFVSLQPKGYAGVEGYYDSELNPPPGVRRERGRTDVLVVTPTLEGADLVLTVDLALQTYVEQRLQQALQETRAQSGVIVVMDTRTGAILASAVAPGYDPNRAVELAAQPGLLVDPVVSVPYEPGSVLKVMTIAAGLEKGLITPNSILTDTGRLVISGRAIRNAEGIRRGRASIEDVLALSLNVPTAQIALDLGAKDFYERLSLFGFGSITGIDLANESPGRLRTPRDVEWSRTDLATNSFGQGMMATPIQVLNAFNTVANDGMWMQPYVVRKWKPVNSTVVHKQPTPSRVVISAETARTLRELMARASRRATPQALPPECPAAGKTGTAEWYRNGVRQETTIVTYVGFAPVLEPRFTVLVKLDQPQSSRWAAPTTGPVFRDVVAYLCRRAGIASARAG
ncbi:MAG: penicillin-binding protein 2 [Anaerolineae bacterium]|nr:penicillin-binding protein 2 [Thermoflexales bacterium]MDW8395632.1 penicillin-binding protein 2 [Anaerolineae bacterium]